MRADVACSIQVHTHTFLARPSAPLLIIGPTTKRVFRTHAAYRKTRQDKRGSSTASIYLQ
jgi:hypothetical protein